jgi:hypothetical protein
MTKVLACQNEDTVTISAAVEVAPQRQKLGRPVQAIGGRENHAIPPTRKE